MRTLLVLLALIPGLAFAATGKEAAPESLKQDSAKSQTEHTFDELLVQGKYHFSDEAVTTVEEDKVLDALIGVRTEFKDRIEQSSSRN